jgi:nucleoside-diphosphate-sugar epimerase
MKKILITGGAGFLGYHLARFFSKKGYDLTLSDIHPFDPEEYTGNYRLFLVDVRDKKGMKKLIEKVDIVIHAAAALPLAKKEEIETTTIAGTKNILDLSLSQKVKRVIYISSTAVYGVPRKHPVSEEDPLVGVGPYGAAKIEAEKLCWRYIKKGLNVTIIRPKTFVGTGRLGVFEILFDWIHDNKKIPVIGNGNNRYQLLDVDDLVSAIYLFILKNKKEYNDIFNVGAEKFQTVKKDLETMFRKVGSKSRVFPVPSFLVKPVLRVLEKLHLSPLYQWVYDTADKDSFVSIEKIKKTLGWQPRYSNVEALVKAYRWYLKHYDKIKAKPAGITHTAGWKQGALVLVKKIM